MHKEFPKIIREYPNTLQIETNIKSKYDFADIAKWCLYNKTDVSNIIVTIIEKPDILHKLSEKGNIELQAIVFPGPIKHTYQIITDKPTPEIITHECVHIWQFEREDLQKIDNTYFWKGEEYSNTTAYENRPWEKEAFSLERIWWKDYKKNLKNY